MKRVIFVIGLWAGVLLAAPPVQAQGGGQDHSTHEGKNKSEAVQAEKKEIKPQTTCPVMGGAIDKALYIDHEGKRIYICCKGCEAPVKKDPAKYIKMLEAAGVTLDRTPEDKNQKP